jgi:hypothetical protein
MELIGVLFIAVVAVGYWLYTKNKASASPTVPVSPETSTNSNNVGGSNSGQAKS